MFDFVTISNGVAVVQHTVEGHVYRFKPVQRDLWDKLSLSGFEANEAANTPAEVFAGAALRFAERAAAECMYGPSDISDLGPMQEGGGLSTWLMRRRTKPSAVPDGAA